MEALKREDRAEEWYADWADYQAKHRLYASILAPRAYSSHGSELDLLRLTRFWEVFAYFSPAHAYSLHVSFLGICPFLMSNNEALKREAVAALEAGGLFAFAVSEKDHGSDLLGNEFTVKDGGMGRLSARGGKYYIGNVNAAALVAVLAKKERRRRNRPVTPASGPTDGDGDGGAPAFAGGTARRATPLFFALRPKESGVLRDLHKIRTLGVRTAFVGGFSVDGHEFPHSDVLSEGRAAWEMVFATVNLGKFFLGFGSIGMCEHALEEALAHTRQRILYGKPVAEMPHIRSAIAHAYAKLTAMKLYAYRALDYLHAANQDDRRYLLFTSVQKAKVSTEGVKVMAMLSECVGARGFEADTYFETALRDVPLVPALEGSTHINHEMAAQFLQPYFRRCAPPPASPPSLASPGVAGGENPYLMEQQSAPAHAVGFAHYLAAYAPLGLVPNARLFARQVRAFRLFLLRGVPVEDPRKDAETVIALGKCLAAIAFGQLVAENCALAAVPAPIASVVFHHCMEDLTLECMRLSALPQTGALARLLLGRVTARPNTRQSDLDFVSRWMAGDKPDCPSAIVGSDRESMARGSQFT